MAAPEPDDELEPGVGRLGIHVLPFACSVVRSVTCVAVAVPLLTTATTDTVSPDLTLEIPVSPPLTLVLASTVNVADVPSALATVSDQVEPDVLEMADTVPLRSSIVSYPFGPWTVYWP